MIKSILLLLVAVTLIIGESSSLNIIRPTYRPLRRGPVIILPTYRPPIRRGSPIIRRVREANDEPLWLNKDDNIPRAPTTGDHPFLPSIIDDIKLDPHRRIARSVDSPSAKRHGGHSSTSGGNRGSTGPTHPGYNRRNAREIRIPDIYDPFRPTLPKPFNPFKPGSIPRRPFPIYARTARDIQFPGIKKPTYRDVIIPNWNPNVRVNPWDRFGKARNTRSIEMVDSQEELLQSVFPFDEQV